MRELLLLLCRYPFDDTNREHLSKLIGEVRDWPELVKLINAHGIIALAAYNIKASGLEKQIPGDSMSVLENGYLKSVVRNSWLTERWKEINSLLSNAGIKHILLKGMALEHTVYGSNGLRQMGDNDILVKRDDSLLAWKLLQQEGFAPEPLKSPLFRKIMFDIGLHLPALFKNGYAIEIHDNLFDRRITSGKSNIDPFADTREISVAGTKAIILSGELQIMHLIEHFEKHKLAGDCQLRLYADIKLLDKTSPVEIPDHFIYDPLQGYKAEFRKAGYKTTIRSIPVKHRLRFILGDLFPSVNWMKKRYRCTWLGVLLWYPLRIGKLRWLIE
jgi:hypothetical protein